MNNLVFLLKWIGLVTIACIVSCSPPVSHVYGVISTDYNGKNILLFRLAGDSIAAIDSVEIRNGEFTFRVPSYIEDISVLTVGEYPTTLKTAYLYLEAGQIGVDLNDTAKVWGTPLNNDCYRYFHIINTYHSKAATANEDVAKAELKKAVDAIVSIVRKNQTNILGRQLITWDLLSEFGFKAFWDETPFMSFYEEGDDWFKATNEVDRTYQIRKKMKEERRVADSVITHIVINPSLKTLSGDEVKLHDLLEGSEHYYLEFWNAYCGPCIKQMAEIKELKKRYSNKQLKIISISLDSSIDVWKKACHSVDVPWVHLSELVEFKQSQFTQTYKISGIPFGILLDSNKRIINALVIYPFLEYYMKEKYKTSEK